MNLDFGFGNLGWQVVCVENCEPIIEVAAS
jgi:hypothetical protein